MSIYFTNEERILLENWISDGNDPNHNPWYMAGEDGRPLDLISAWRIMLDLEDEHLAKP